MKIGFIGAGNVAAGLGKFWYRNGHELFLSSSGNPEKLKNSAASIGEGVQYGTTAEAAAFASILVLAVPYAAVRDALASTGNLNGKILLSCVNPLKADMSGLEVGTNMSAAEEIAQLVPTARIVEGLPPFADLLRAPTQEIGGQRGSIFVASDDAEAKEFACGLLRETGFAIVDAGPLRAARFIEPAMMLLIHLAYKQKLGTNLAIRLLQVSQHDRG